MKVSTYFSFLLNIAGLENVSNESYRSCDVMYHVPFFLENLKKMYLLFEFHVQQMPTSIAFRTAAFGIPAYQGIIEFRFILFICFGHEHGEPACKVSGLCTKGVERNTIT
jgi:hypothetical protein